MLLIGITGGFLTGKSTVAEFFKAKRISILSADKIYHRLLLENKVLQKKIIRAFGTQILIKGKISRRRLKQRVVKKCSFTKLNKITHPFIIEKIRKKINEYNTKKNVLIIETPLLYEAKLEKLFDIIIVVSASLAVQIRRAKKAGLARKDALTLIRSQLPLVKKERMADFVIRNNGTLKELKAEVEKIYRNIIQVK